MRYRTPHPISDQNRASLVDTMAIRQCARQGHASHAASLQVAIESKLSNGHVLLSH